MSLATLSECLEHDTVDGAIWADVACSPSFKLVDKIDIINCSIRAEPLGSCGLTPHVPYDIDSFERRGPSKVLVHFTARFGVINCQKTMPEWLRVETL